MEKYINNDKLYGLDYDWKAIRKEYKKLKCPAGVYNPCKVPIENCNYVFGISVRNTGKTTNWLLFGMCMHKLYGTRIIYCRNREDQILPNKIRNIFSVIRDYGYIPKLTDGAYNDVIYKSRRWYYCLRGDNGEVIDTASESFCLCVDIEEAQNYKSVLNEPQGDLVIFDEYVDGRYRNSDFIDFMNLLSTIFRSRLSGRVVMLCNNITPYSPWYNEFMINKDIRSMVTGESRSIVTPKGTHIYIEKLEGASNDRLQVNSSYFGFDNQELAGITGGEWAIMDFPHIAALKEDEREIVDQHHYLKYNDILLRLDIATSERYGVHVLVHRATKVYEDSVIYTIGEYEDTRHRHKFGWSKVDQHLWNLYKKNKWFYQDNDCGNIIISYIAQSKYL